MHSGAAVGDSASSPSGLLLFDFAFCHVRGAACSSTCNMGRKAEDNLSWEEGGREHPGPGIP